jgi:hypothetical protein
MGRTVTDYTTPPPPSTGTTTTTEAFTETGLIPPARDTMPVTGSDGLAFLALVAAGAIAAGIRLVIRSRLTRT